MGIERAGTATIFGGQIMPTGIVEHVRLLAGELHEQDRFTGSNLLECLRALNLERPDAFTLTLSVQDAAVLIGFALADAGVGTMLALPKRQA